MKLSCCSTQSERCIICSIPGIDAESRDVNLPETNRPLAHTTPTASPATVNNPRPGKLLTSSKSQNFPCFWHQNTFLWKNLNRTEVSWTEVSSYLYSTQCDYAYFSLCKWWDSWLRDGAPRSWVCNKWPSTFSLLKPRRRVEGRSESWVQPVLEVFNEELQTHVPFDYGYSQRGAVQVPLLWNQQSSFPQCSWNWKNQRLWCLSLPE